MILALDIGNTNTRMGLVDADGSISASWNVTTSKTETSDEAYVRLLQLLEAFAPDAQVDDAIVASVVPPITEAWASACKRISGRRTLVVGPGVKTGVKTKYGDPSTIGADRICDFIAAKHEYGSPCVIVDTGTATNIEVLDEEGAFCGGIIAPGLTISSEALARSASKLPHVELDIPDSVLGRNTRETMQIGLVMGEVARVDGLVHMVWDELGYTTDVVATGGAADTLARRSSTIKHVDQDLTLKGLALLYAKNRG